MKLEIQTVYIDQYRKAIIIDLENIDKQIGISIPTSEYKQWLKFNGLEKAEEHLQTFVNEYLSGIINTDETAQFLLKQIFAILTEGKKTTMYSFNCEDKPCCIEKGKFGYRLFREDKRQGHQGIVEIYASVMRSIEKPINLN